MKLVEEAMPPRVATVAHVARRTLSVAAGLRACEYARLCFTPAAG